MDITIIAVGKLKEKYWRDAVSEYSRRMKSYCSLNILERKEFRLRANPGLAEEQEVIRKEGEEILSVIRPEQYVITLEIKGKRMTSEQLAKKIDDLMISGESSLAFVIGGSLGLSSEVSGRADLKLSFSDMTFPHQLMRVVLLEQIYRSFRIIRGEPYHK